MSVTAGASGQAGYTFVTPGSTIGTTGLVSVPVSAALPSTRTLQQTTRKSIVDSLNGFPSTVVCSLRSLASHVTLTVDVFSLQPYSLDEQHHINSLPYTTVTTRDASNSFDLVLAVDGNELPRFSTNGSTVSTQWSVLTQASVYVGGTMLALGPIQPGVTNGSVGSSFGLGVALETKYGGAGAKPSLVINSRSSYQGFDFSYLVCHL